MNHRSAAMPTRPAHGKQARAERTRAAILDGTVRHLLEYGLDGSSIKHIAQTAGVTWGVVQYHFGDREGLLIAVVEKGFDELIESMEPVAHQIESVDVEQRVDTVVNAAWTAMSSPTSRAAMEILIGTRTNRGASAKHQLSRLNKTFVDLGRWIDDSLDNSQAKAIGNLLMTNLRGLVTTQLIMPRAVDTTHDRQLLVELVTAYLSARRRAEDPASR